MDKAVAVLGSRFACRSKCVCSHNINISTCPPILGDTMDNDAAVLASRLFAAATVSAAKPSRTQPFSQRQMCPQPIFTCPPALGGVDSAGLLSLQGTARSEHIKISPVHVMEAPAAVGVKTRRLFQLTLPPITSVILRGIYMPDDLAPP